MKAIYKRELASYFNNVIGWVIISFTLLILGLYASSVNLMTGYPNIAYALSSCCFLFIIITPIITMRVMVDDKKQNTNVMLYASPVTTLDIVAGKYLAMLTVFAIPVAVCCAFPLIFSLYGTVDFAASYLAIFGFLLLGATLLAVGMFVSSLTESYLVAALATFGVMLLMYLMSALETMVSDSAQTVFIALTVLCVLAALLMFYMTKHVIASVAVGCVMEIASFLLFLFGQDKLEGGLSAAMSWIAVYDRFSDFCNGILSASSIVYYLSAIFLFGFLTVQALEKRRWS